MNSLPKNKEAKIPVCFATDDAYSEPCAVAISSLLFNSPDLKFDIFILDGGISKKNKVNLSKIINFFKSQITFIKIDDERFDSFHLPKGGHFNKVTYYRLMIPSLIKNYNKIIYLDCDVIVKKNIKDLYQNNIAKHYLAATKAQFSKKNKMRLVLPKSSNYVNTGVLLFNAKKWRENNIQSKMFDYIKKARPTQLLNVDQDAINYVLSKDGDIKLIEQNWNTEFRTDLETLDKYKEIVKNPYIIHYLSGDKPWHDNTRQNTTEYIKYYKLLKKILSNKADYETVKLLNLNKIKEENAKNYLTYKKTRKSKVAIYTAISNNYDQLIQHKYLSKDFDYICFTDQKIKNPGIWEIRKLRDINADNVRKARYHKVFPNKILPNYDFSIWIDANIDVLDNTLDKRVLSLIKNNVSISAIPHFERNCIYQEAKTCIDLEKDDPSTILKEVAYLKKENYPKNHGLHETNLIFRKHNKPKIVKVMEDWWQMIKNFSFRDQLSFDYVLWDNKLKSISLFPQNARLMTDAFEYRGHNTKIVSTLFIDSGNGYNENDFIQDLVVVSNNQYKATFNLTNQKGIKNLKLNILKNQFCKFELMKIKLDNELIPISKFKIKSNGKKLNKSTFDFPNISNPEITFSIKKKYKEIQVCGIIYIYNLDDLIKYTYQLEEDLNKIKSSKMYRAWQKYNDLKKYFRKIGFL